MPDTDVLTYEQTPPRRPVLDDMGGGLYEDDAAHPPGPDHPSANATNQTERLVVAAHSIIPHTEIYVTIASSTPSVAGVASVRTDLSTSDFTPTDGGAGITDVTHTGGMLPAATMPAWARGVGDFGDTVFSVDPISNGWRVRARTGGTLTDNKSFVLVVYGL